MASSPTTNGNGKNGSPIAAMGLTGIIRRLAEVSIVVVFALVLMYQVRESSNAAREDRLALRDAVTAILREAVKGQREDLRGLRVAVEKLSERLAEKREK